MKTYRGTHSGSDGVTVDGRPLRVRGELLWRGWCGADGRRGGEVAVVLEGEAQ